MRRRPRDLEPLLAVVRDCIARVGSELIPAGAAVNPVESVSISDGDAIVARAGEDPDDIATTVQVAITPVR